MYFHSYLETTCNMANLTKYLTKWCASRLHCRPMSLLTLTSISMQCSLASDFNWNWGQREASASFGYDYILRQCRLRGRIDTDGKVNFALFVLSPQKALQLLKLGDKKHFSPSWKHFASSSSLELGVKAYVSGCSDSLYCMPHYMSLTCKILTNMFETFCNWNYLSTPLESSSS